MVRSFELGADLDDQGLHRLDARRRHPRSERPRAQRHPMRHPQPVPAPGGYAHAHGLAGGSSTSTPSSRDAGTAMPSAG